MKGEDIPGEIPCDASHRVLQWVGTATHRSATNAERFEH